MPSVSMRVESSRPVAGHLTIKEVMRGSPFRVIPHPTREVNARPSRAVKRNCLGSMIPLLLTRTRRRYRLGCGVPGGEWEGLKRLSLPLPAKRRKWPKMPCETQVRGSGQVTGFGG
jgi:hypothetical protein